MICARVNDNNNNNKNKTKEEEDLGMIQLVKHVIEERIKNHSNASLVREKFRWLFECH